MTFCPIGSGLFDRTVTVYRKEGEIIQRQVIENCYLTYEDILRTGLDGDRMERKFLLIVSHNAPIVRPGSRVFDGIGPEVSLEKWDSFIPVNVPGLMKVSYAKAYSWGGRTSHVEAGGQ